MIKTIPIDYKSRRISRNLKSESARSYQLQIMSPVIKLFVFLFSGLFAQIAGLPSQTQDLEDKVAHFRHCMQEFVDSSVIVEQSSNATLYERLNHQWNLRKQKVYPLAYFLPTATEDVQLAVFCGSQAGIQLIPKSGGHSYESFAEGNNQSIVIDFRRMNRIEVDANARIATIQPGAIVGSINLKTWAKAKMAIPMGQCHTLGIGGHALGGGIGYFSHVFGLTLDNVVELQMVDASGKVNRVSLGVNPDLYWALRGIGSGFIGIVTQYKFKMFEADKIKITFVKVNYDMNHTMEALQGWEDWLQWTGVNEPQVMTLMQIKKFETTFFNLRKGIEIHAVHIQDEKKQPRNSDNFLKAINQIFPPKGRNVSVTYPNYMETVIDTSYAPTQSGKEALEVNLGNLSTYPPLVRYFKGKSIFVNGLFSPKELAPVAELITRMPKQNILVVFNTERGAIHNVKPDQTTYSHRNIQHTISIQYEGPNKAESVAEGMKYMEEFMQGIKFMDSGETYQNFVDLDLNDEYMDRYYGQNLPKLLYTKKVWDPNNYFRNQQSLPVQSN